MTPPTPRVSYSGRTRERKTRPSVRWQNKIAATVITIGGISTVLAVGLVFVFLVSVAVPIFFPPRVSEAHRIEKQADLSEADLPLRHFAIDEYQTMAWSVTRGGDLLLVHLEDGSLISRKALFAGRSLTDLRFLDNTLAAGFSDGSLQYGSVSFSTRFIPASELSEEIRLAASKGSIAHEGGILQGVSDTQFRLQTLVLDLKEPVMIEAGSAVEKIDISIKNTGPIIAALTSTGTLHMNEVSIQRNMVTRKETIRLFGGSLAIPAHESGALPSILRLTGLGDNAILAWDNGDLIRVDARVIETLSVTETTNLLRDGATRLTLLDFLIGKSSLVSGDDRGHLDVWFRTKPDGASTGDGATLVRAHRLEPMPSAPVALSVSARIRMIASGDADGNVHLNYVTNTRHLSSFHGDVVQGGMYGLALAPKDDALYAWGSTGLYAWDLDVPHPEINVRQILGKVWYEGFNEPAHVWQSSSGTDDFEPKYGMVPLIFGTIKATFYSLLFGVPLAILAAVYSSEIMGPKLRSYVKPTIETMASLPSVVLGFLAALVIAPAVEDKVAQMLACFVTIPFALLLGAHLWQLLPQTMTNRLRFVKLPIMLLFSALGFWLCGPVGVFAEQTLFLGDIKRWLATGEGSGTGGWMIILAPLCGVFTMWVNGRHITPVLRRAFESRGRMAYVFTDLLRFLISTIAAVVVAYAISSLLALGWDPRGSFIDTYVQRNALIVGFVMGFAIIPIIYTLCEDAMSAVPETLRAASLGAGATPWQTAMRIVIPTAASGFFSAVMIGFGRAVGETMIVLMAAGNTPVLEWNIFNGFRTLSANIAVELPEAVRDSSHYRMLFLSALTLFVMTFTLNSMAEVVRQRFRKRAFEL
jgi:phosphate transport system permease protein